MKRSGSRGRCEEVRKSGVAWGIPEVGGGMKRSGSPEWRGEVRKSGVAWRSQEVGDGRKMFRKSGEAEGVQVFLGNQVFRGNSGLFGVAFLSQTALWEIWGNQVLKGCQDRYRVSGP